MLLITADVFSGRPNPSWVVSDTQEVRKVLRQLADSRPSAASPDAGLADLGRLRGLRISLQSDELALDHALEPTIYLPLQAAGGGALHDLADRLIDLAQPAGLAEAAARSGDPTSGQPFPDDLQAFLRERMTSPRGLTGPDSNSAAHAEAAQAQQAPAVTCMIEFGAYNPGFWNNDANIRSRNNCYNYASNKRTDTFAQPGRGSGHIYTAITCAAVSAAALSDGLHQRFVCFPDTEKPRYLVALVIAPGPGFVDFHWYRKNSEGFWSHKPGGTAVRNFDNSNLVITDPATCNRGPYTQFCGYFYTCRSQRIN